MKRYHAIRGRHRGFTLIEVLVGILIFALGMMALAKLQGNLARNSADANARTVATNIAEEAIEAARSFGQITSDGTNVAYNDIVDGSRTVTRGGIAYTVVSEVTDYYYDPATQSFTTTAPDSAGKSDFKHLDLTVTWNASQEFEIDGTNMTSGRLGSGSITLSDVISSITSPSGGKVALGTGDDNSYAPPVDYNPGQNPDIISIQLGANKFKESTTPLPNVIRADELVETTFDVVTYSQDQAGATFLRREEFRAVSCECVLRLPSDTDEGGLRPTVWNGNDYSQGEWVMKPYGEEANNQQSEYCGLCCRDHHDGGFGAEDDANDPGRSRYYPFRSTDQYHDSGALAGDHKHYNRDNQGNLALADSDGDTYVEACRLIRKDGFWRVAQDLRQEGLNSFPADYLDEESEVSVYSNYVTNAVSIYESETNPANDDYPTNAYEEAPPVLTAPANMVPPRIWPASTYDNPTAFPLADGGTEQQLRSRGIYIDYMSDVLRERINCLDNLDPDGSGADCGVPGVTTALEIIPFYDVQLTWLSRWNETPNNNPVDVTNEAIADDNTHDRGMASQELGFGYSTINAAVHGQNLGLTGTDPIDPLYQANVKEYDLYALTLDPDMPPPVSSNVISGDILSSVPGVRASDVEIEATGAQCDRTNTGFECYLEIGAANPRIKFYNYFKPNRILFACSDVLIVQGTEHSGDNPAQNWTRFDLPAGEVTDAHVVIKENGCGG